MNETNDTANALRLMWAFASHMVEKHGMDGDDTMTDEDHQLWQEAGGMANATLSSLEKSKGTK